MTTPIDKTDRSVLPLTDEYRVLDAEELVEHLHTEIKAGAKLSQTRSNRLVHELRSHQIELELQNRQLRESRREIERQRDCLALLYDEAPVGYITLDHRGYVKEANQRSIELFGGPSEDIIDRPIAALFDSSSRVALRQHLLTLFQLKVDTVRPLTVEVSFRDSAHARHFVRLQSRPIFSQTGAVTSAHIAIIDIDETRAAQKDLQAERNFIDSLLNTAHLIIVLLDQHGRVQRCNRHFERLSGYPRHSVIGENWVELCVLPEDASRASKGFSASSHQMQNWTMNMDLQLRDGSIRSIDWRNTRVPANATLREAGVLCIGTDVTLIRASQEREMRHVRQLAHIGRLTLAHQLTGQFAHELNQPLTAALNYSHVIKSLLADPQSDRSVLNATMDKLHRQTKRAGDIIQHLRRFTSRRKPDLKPTSLNDCVTEAFALLDKELREANARIDIDLDLDLPRINADALLIEQVIVNLVQNALQAMAESQDPQQAKWLRIRTRKVADDVELNVQDNGPGIAPDVMEKVLNGFYTTKADGVGLGLVICRSIVEIHHGRLTSKSLVDGGQSFCLRLPIYTQHPLTSTQAE